MKKLNYLSFLFILSLLIGCSQPRVKIDNLEDRLGNYREYGHLIKIEGEPFSGIAYQEYSDGTIFIELSVRRGIPHGKFKRYYENGQLHEKGTYKNGEFDGPHISYFENGLLWVKATFKNGELDGPFEEYYENGLLRIKGTIKNGAFDGPFEEYYENGQLKFIWD